MPLYYIMSYMILIWRLYLRCDRGRHVNMYEYRMFLKLKRVWAILSVIYTFDHNRQRGRTYCRPYTRVFGYRSNYLLEKSIYNKISFIENIFYFILRTSNFNMKCWNNLKSNDVAYYFINLFLMVLPVKI